MEQFIFFSAPLVLLSVAAEQPIQMRSHGLELAFDAWTKFLTMAPSIKLPGLDTVSRIVTIRLGMSTSGGEEEDELRVCVEVGRGGQGRIFSTFCMDGTAQV